jgi:hypothetical protein
MTERTPVLFLDANILLKRHPTIRVRDAIKEIRRVDPIKFPRAVPVSH